MASERLQRPLTAMPRVPIRHGRYFVAGLGMAVLWTIAGLGIASLAGERDRFLKAWYAFQGFPLLLLGTWLLLIVRSKTFSKRMTAITRGNVPAPNKRVRPALILGIGLVAIVSLASMGFPGAGLLKAFFLLACAAIAFTAAVITSHAFEMLIVAQKLESAQIRVFHYAPASTDLIPCTRPKRSMISDERKGNKDVEKEAEHRADHRGSEAA